MIYEYMTMEYDIKVNPLKFTNELNDLSIKGWKLYKMIPTIYKYPAIGVAILRIERDL